MRRANRNNGFILCFILNLLLNFEWSIPAWFFLIMHFCVKWPLWLFLVTFIGWLLFYLIVTIILCWVSSCSNDETQKKVNRNPYSTHGDDLPY